MCGSPTGESDNRLACGQCWTRVPFLAAPQCERCGYPRVGDDACRWCPLLPPYVRAVRSVAWMPQGVAGELVHALKYQGWWRLAEELGERMARVSWPQDVVDERAAVVAVPLAPRRLRERGFNQAESLGAVVAQRWRIPLWREVLKRERFVESQTRLTQDQRLYNVARAFHVDGDPVRLRGTHLMLVDDVVTTGATMNACAAALFAAGARVVSYITFGRARLPGDVSFL